MRLSAVVITLNEESNLERCLKCLEFADEIVVIDSMSTDLTVDIAKKYTDKVALKEFKGFGEQKAAAIAMTTGEWVLIVDADEAVSKELAVEVRRAISNGGCDAYRIPRLSHFLGRPIRHCGWYPDYQLRLALKSKASMPERLVHEHLCVDGKVGTLQSPLIHHSYGDMADFTRKMVHYARAAAEQKQREGCRPRISNLLFTPGLTFVKIYILKQGFRDGLRGLIISGLNACSVFLRYVMLWDMVRRENCAKEQDLRD